MFKLWVTLPSKANTELLSFGRVVSIDKLTGLGYIRRAVNIGVLKLQR